MIKYLIPLTFLLSSCSMIETAIEIEELINDPYNDYIDYPTNWERCEWLLELDTIEQWQTCICECVV